MKRSLAQIALMVCITSATYAQYGYSGNTNVSNQINTNLDQNTNVIGGGSSNSDSFSYSGGGNASATSGNASSGSYINYAPTSNANYQTRVPPLGFVAPYLPMWQHGGWGTIKGYFSNGPTTDNAAYELMFNPENKEDMQMLKRLQTSSPYTNVFTAVGGLFTGTLKTHRLRGFAVANAVMRDKREKGKPVMIMIDSNIDKELLKKAGYAYVGKISVEGKESRNWDQCYGAIIAEALPWDIDIMLVSGGMKGVSVGNTTAYGGGGGYSQTNYSLSVFGSKSHGVTESKGKPILSADCYRYHPQLAFKRNSPRDFYKMLQVRYAKAPQAATGVATASPQQAQRVMSTTSPTQGAARKQPNSSGQQGVNVNSELMEMAGVKPLPYVDYVAAQPVTVNP